MVPETKTECLRKTLHCNFVLNSNPNDISCIETIAASKEENLNTEEAINFIFADEDSDFESNSEEEEESGESSDNDQDSSDENNNDHEIPAQDVVREEVFKHEVDRPLLSVKEA